MNTTTDQPEQPQATKSKPQLKPQLNIPAPKHPRTAQGDAVIAREKAKLMRDLFGNDR